MRVKVLCNLKNGSQFIGAGSIFESCEDDLPDFIQYELAQNRGTVEVLPEPVSKKCSRPKKENAKKVGRKKASTIRDKFRDSE